ncbi:MAG: cysteine--tRNA ligase [Rhodospirillales bacterium]|nr:cysteine--tRNA ligase [Rhodospirillales bacterium]
MTLHLYNTLTRAKEAFVPLRPDAVGLYVCGPTVYDFAHIGNARPVVVFDVLYRLMKRLFSGVTYVRNITDVDDKIIAASQKSGEPIDVITARTAAAFHDDMDALGALPPTIEPRATAHIAQMIVLIEALIAKGHAYAPGDGHVLFHVPSMADYGQLSRLDRREVIEGARVEVAGYKKDPADFVLWKPSTDEQPGWPSPWGRGRPGWHIECSAMSGQYLGETFDIHGGGQDLIFPHHENEIAQSRCAHDTPMMARVWMHNGYLMVEGEKMSKSLGNFFTVRQLLADHPGEALRLTLLQTHYRQPLNWTADGVRQAKETLDRCYTALRAVADVKATVAEPPPAVLDALADDLNTPLAIAHLHEAVGTLNKAAGAEEKAALKGRLLAAGDVLGLLSQDPEAWFKWCPAAAASPDDAAIEALIVERREARKAKNFARADQIRDELKAQGILLEDGAGATTWRRG